MANLYPSLDELSPYSKRIDLLEKVVIQLKKDFSWFNLSITFTEQPIKPYQQLFMKVLPLVDDLLNNDYAKLLGLLYRIDVDEVFLNKCLNKNQQADTNEIITDLILKRELQKVVIRSMSST